MAMQDQSETNQRLQKVLQGAFSGPPTPLKKIPKKNGESRGKQPKKKKKR
jgi:hypothetical protein